MRLPSLNPRRWFRDQQPKHVRRFDAAAGGRRWDWSPSFGSIGQETLAAVGSIRSRARYFAANNSWAAKGVLELTTGAVGSGITAASQHPNPETRKALGDYFVQWAATCDADGLTNWGGIQAGAVRAKIVDGEALVHMPITDTGLKLRQIPSEMLDDSKTGELANGARDISGVRFDAKGNRLGYWILPQKPTDVFATSGPSVLVPADEMCHVFQPIGAGQVRGISWLAPIMLRLAEHDGLEDALLLGAKIAAMHAGFLIDQNGAASNSPYDGTTDANGILESGLEPGTLKILPTGFDIRFSSPQQAQQLVDFGKMQLRAIAAGLGVPEHLLTGDLSQANYSSLRAALVAYRARLEALQFNILVPQLLDRVWRRAITFGILSGQIEAPDFAANAADYFRVDWFPPPIAHVDPEKEIAAEVAAISAGLTSRRQVVASRGYSVETLDAEIAADRQREVALGLNFDAAPKGPSDA
ncbi:phage portal protein [Enhydrobacter sp.]|jgi:lambda family phage portal protein|uniref:phage portal protein n=1 Tax=Enhydrobacter sp. TaxID=1894999 RepID=UPI002613A96F|nr:phage portal protein [Enhydrobacter sp.]WIM10597.1 MAG: Phage head, portal protein B [Enhydrobacter sp.]